MITIEFTVKMLLVLVSQSFSVIITFCVSVFSITFSFRLYAPAIFNKFANFEPFLKRFEALPAVANYHKSSRCMRWPINDRVAKWGTEDEPSPYN